MRRLFATLVCLPMLGCLYANWHEAERYRFDPAASRQVQAQAMDRCEARGFPQGIPDLPFLTDGCSMWLDGTWQQCCVEHDMDYWCGGSEADRWESDRELAQCVGGTMGKLMRFGVVVGGRIPAPRFGWGYGHSR